MPITLEKLFSPTADVKFPFLGETVNVTWAPFRYTGEMQALWDVMLADHETRKGEIAKVKAEADQATADADALAKADAEPEQIKELRAAAADLYDRLGTLELRADRSDKEVLRRTISQLVVTWDVLDDDGKPIPTDVETLTKLPDPFLWAIFRSLSMENQPDPQKAPTSNEPSDTEKGSAPSPTGTSSSPAREPSASRRSSSTKERTAPASIRSGALGH